MDNNNSEIKKRSHFHFGSLILVIIIIIVLFKVNIEKVLNSPAFQQNVTYIEKQANNAFIKVKSFFKIPNSINFSNSVFDQKVQPSKIDNYFGIPSDDTLNKLGAPIKE